MYLTITINGGDITATGGSNGAGIGGGYGGAGGTITINDGDITAIGGLNGAGIGGGSNGGAGGTITINGGGITATGGSNGVGIGKGSGGSVWDIIVWGSYGYWTNTTASAPSVMTGSGSFDGDSSSIFTQVFRYVKLITVESITSAAITVTAPVIGVAPSATASVVEAVYFTAGAVTWSPTATTFAGSTPYAATVTLTANSGYVFASTLTTATINGNAATVTSNTGATVTLSYTFAATATEITSAAIAGVTAPVRGATPVSTLSSTEEYMATIAWSPSHAAFAANTVYTATITITPKAGYTLTGVPANFFTVAGATATNAANSGTITAVFPATASSTGGGGGGGSPAAPSGGGSPAAPSGPPANQKQTPVTPEPSVEVFNRNIVNEAEFVKTLAAKAAEAKEANGTVELADTQGHWAEKTIDLFVQLKVISGYPDGSFRPDKPITRAEFALLLNRVFQIQGGNKTTDALKDIDAVWKKDIENLVAAG